MDVMGTRFERRRLVKSRMKPLTSSTIFSSGNLTARAVAKWRVISPTPGASESFRIASSCSRYKYCSRTNMLSFCGKTASTRIAAELPLAAISSKPKIAFHCHK